MTVFSGDADHPPLWQRDVLAVLPFQVNPNKHVVAVYVMTRDATQEFEPAKYRLRINGVQGSAVTCYDPVEDRAIPVDTRHTAADVVDVILPVAAHPRLLVLQ